MADLDIETVRSQFPALASGYIYADSAGGSQILQPVVDRLVDYLTSTNCQLGGSYSVGAKTNERVAAGVKDAATLFNAKSPEEVTFGHNSTALMENLARALEADIQPGDEFIVTSEHETNVGPWKKLAARRGIEIKYWDSTPDKPDNPFSVSQKVADLLPLISSKTRLVAFSACSNILGSVVPVKEVVAAVRKEAKEKGAPTVQISLDCVAYAPHRRMDVQDWDVDFAVFSVYKVYGPHVGALYVRSSALQALAHISHHFLPANAISKLQLGGAGYEMNWATTGILPYLLSLTPAHTLEASFDAIAHYEQKLLSKFLGYLRSKEERGVRVVGNDTESLSRVPTVCFVVIGQRPMKSRDLVEAVDRKGGIGIRYGHFYAYKLLDELQPKIDMNDGVVRISFLHYNTVSEVERIIEVLEEVLA